jgi:hypothetical protein
MHRSHSGLRISFSYFAFYVRLSELAVACGPSSKRGLRGRCKPATSLARRKDAACHRENPFVEAPNDPQAKGSVVEIASVDSLW